DPKHRGAGGGDKHLLSLSCGRFLARLGGDARPIVTGHQAHCAIVARLLPWRRRNKLGASMAEGTMMARLTSLILALILAMALPAAAAGWRDKVTQFAAENFKNPAWGFSHSQRDYDLAKSLAAADHVILDDDVIFAAAYLHDMAAFDK